MKLMYNVTVSIDHNVETEWVDWMTKVHIPDVMATGKFLSYSMQKIIGGENETGITYAIQYVAPDMATFEEYQRHDAPELQKDHTQRYQGKFAAFRTLMHVVSHS